MPELPVRARVSRAGDLRQLGTEAGIGTETEGLHHYAFSDWDRERMPSPLLIGTALGGLQHSD